MSKKNKNSLLPKLRFPEFINDGEWEDCTIDAIGNVVTGGTPSKHESEFWGGDFVWLTAQDFKEKYIYDSSLKLTEKGKKKSRVIPQNSVLVTCIASIGLNGINKVECSTNQQINSIICNSANFYEFIYYAISRNINRLKSLAGQTAVPIINKSTFEKFAIHKPLPKEQQKIASCLSSLDEVITAESQKLGVLKDQKNGLLQNLFPNCLNYDSSDLYDEHDSKNQGNQENQKNQGSDNVPKFRFKEFENSGEWVVKKLGEVVEKVGSGVTPLGGEANYKQTGRPLVRSQNVSWGTFLLDNIAFIDEETHQNQISTEIKNDDVLLNITGASIGRSAVANEYVVGGNVNQHVCIIRVKIERLHPYYLNQFLISDFGQKQIDSFQAGGNRQGLNFAQIRSFSIPIPTIKEQQKIASCLSSIDDLIIAQNKKIEALQLHKKGLLQGLFPSITNYESENYDNNVIRNSKFLIEK